jgi:hypothetical protein
MLGNVNDDPLGGGGAGDPGAPTINAKKHRWWAPWEVPQLEIRERRPLTLRNVDGGPLVGADEDPGGSTINAKKRRRRPP